MINIPVWMTLKSYSRLREEIINNNTIMQLVHFGRGVFGSDFGTTAFIIYKKNISDYQGLYRKLYSKQGAVASIEEKESLFLQGYGCYHANQNSFCCIDGAPIAYSLNPNILKLFANELKVCEVGTTRLGMTTADNNKFTRLWFEVERRKTIHNASNGEDVFLGKYKWVPYNKGGAFRKWYGNNDFVVNWENDGYEIKHFSDDNGHIRSTVPNTEYYFKECITWSKVTAGSIAFRYRHQGSIFDVAGACLFSLGRLDYLLGLLNSKVVASILAVLSPTLNYEGSHIATIPVLLKNEKQIKDIVANNIELSKRDWDSFETSWDFEKHPLI